MNMSSLITTCATGKNNNFDRPEFTSKIRSSIETFLQKNQLKVKKITIEDGLSEDTILISVYLTGKIADRDCSEIRSCLEPVLSHQNWTLKDIEVENDHDWLADAIAVDEKTSQEGSNSGNSHAKIQEVPMAFNGSIPPD